MPLLLIDLDDTLIDRTAAFRLGARDLLARYRLPAADVEWVMDIDRRGYAPRESVVEHAALGPETRRSLVRALDAGWVP